jgi:hypothetical protein
MLLCFVSPQADKNAADPCENGGKAGGNHAAAGSARRACPNVAQSAGETAPSVARSIRSCISGLGILSPRVQCLTDHCEKPWLSAKAAAVEQATLRIKLWSGLIMSKDVPL